LKAIARIGKPIVLVRNKISIRRKHPVTPPGSQGIGHFTSACTSCFLCVSRCPGNVIKPGLNIYGREGVLMPSLSFIQGFCNFECTICGEVCPSGAILPLTRETKKTVQTGRVHFIRDNCIVINQKTECGACSEHCPTKAVKMVLENKLRVPEVHPDICVGCGACEYACPALPYKSIYVDGNPVHLKARKPKMDKAEMPSNNYDFPF
jgi:ferredoxin